MTRSLAAAVVLTAAMAAAGRTAVTVRTTDPQTGLLASRESLEVWLEAARGSYAYLAFTARRPGERALEDRRRQAQNVYNLATERIATLLFEKRRQQGRLGDQTGDTILLTGSWAIHRGVIDVRLPTGRPLQELIPASRLSFRGLRTTYGRDGFGAALVAVASDSGKETGASRETGYVASSAVLRFAGSSLEEVMAARDATPEAILELRRILHLHLEER